MMRVPLIARRSVIIFIGFVSSCSKPGEGAAVPSSGNPAFRRMIATSGIDGICRMEINRQVASVLKQNMVGTGVILEDRYVLTAAHLLYNSGYPWGKVQSIGLVANNQPADDSHPSILVRGGRVEDGLIPSDGVWTVAPGFEWRPRTRRDPLGSTVMIRHDYGFIDAGPGISGGDFRLGLPKPLKLQVGDAVSVAGFPGDDKRVPGSDASKIFVAKGRVTAIQDTLFSYDVITARGLSGAPVWIEQSGKKHIVGIHVGSDFGGGKEAVARLVDETMIRDWKRWVSLRRKGSR